MPQVRKLAQEEVQAFENKGKGTRKIIEEQYDAFLRDYDVGDYGEAVLDEGESRLNVRNRLKAAATRRGVGLEFRRTQGDAIRFRVVETSTNGKGTADVAVTDEAHVVNSADLHPVPKPGGSKSRGRPKKEA